MEYKPENGIYMYYYDQTNKKQNNIQIKTHKHGSNTSSNGG